MFSLVGAFHEVWCPDARGARMQGCVDKQAIVGWQDWISPREWGYSRRAVVNGSPQGPVIVVVVIIL